MNQCGSTCFALRWPEAAAGARSLALPQRPCPPKEGCAAAREALALLHSMPFYRACEDCAVTTPAKPMPASTAAISPGDDVVARHKKYLRPIVTNYYHRPLVADRGEMQYLWDLEG